MKTKKLISALAKVKTHLDAYCFGNPSRDMSEAIEEAIGIIKEYKELRKENRKLHKEIETLKRKLGYVDAQLPCR